GRARGVRALHPRRVAPVAGESAMSATKVDGVEGYVEARHGFRVWYRVVGSADVPGKRPLLGLHGGPGSTHAYLEPLAEIARTGRQVIFYDQLGNGNSRLTEPHDARLWTISLFLDELRVLRQALGLRRVHLLGHSWGGMLGMEYACGSPSGLQSLIV